MQIGCGNEPAHSDQRLSCPALIVAAGDQTRKRFYEFFTADIRDPRLFEVE
jgi:hypothetical protein